MISQSISLTPGSQIQTIFEAASPSRIDWLSCRFKTLSQSPATSRIISFGLAPFQGYPAGSSLSPSLLNSPQLILHFRVGGNWREWGRAALIQSNQTDWGLIDLRSYFCPGDNALTLGAGGAIGCSLSYYSASDSVWVVGGVSYERGAINSIETAIAVGTIAAEIAPIAARQSVTLHNVGLQTVFIRVGSAPTPSLYLEEIAPNEFVELATGEAIYAIAASGLAEVIVTDQRWL